MPVSSSGVRIGINTGLPKTRPPGTGTTTSSQRTPVLPLPISIRMRSQSSRKHIKLNSLRKKWAKKQVVPGLKPNEPRPQYTVTGASARATPGNATTVAALTSSANVPTFGMHHIPRGPPAKRATLSSWLTLTTTTSTSTRAPRRASPRARTYSMDYDYDAVYLKGKSKHSGSGKGYGATPSRSFVNSYTAEFCGLDMGLHGGDCMPVTMPSTSGDFEGMVDCGATASAGPEEAVKGLRCGD